MRDLVVGIDLGTTACKALVADSNAHVLAVGTANYPTYTPQPGWAEQAAEDVWQGMLQAVRQVMQGPGVASERIAAISFSAAMHGLLPLGETGRPLSRCLIWADCRSQPQAQRIRREHNAHELYLHTGCPLQPLFWPARLLWLQEQRPDIVGAARHYVTMKDYIIQRLVGRYVMDVSQASGIGLLNTHSLTWDDGILHMLNLVPQQLPELVWPETVLGTLDARWADELGLRPDVLVVAGGADGGLANLGAGAVEAGQVVTTIGTSGAVRAMVTQPRFDAQERTWCYVLTQGTWFVGGASSNGGVVYHWLRDVLCAVDVQEAAQFSRDFSDLFDAWAAEIAPGAEGLLFLPFLQGERSLDWRANARGILFGLSMHHTRKHIVRAAVEGVAFRLYSVLQVLQEMLGEAREIRATGGLAYSPPWMSILADVYGQPVSIPQVRESSALGAVFLALKALGWIRDWSDVRPLVAIERVQEPNVTHHQLYLRLYELFQSLYQAAQHHYDELEVLLTPG